MEDWQLLELSLRRREVGQLLEIVCDKLRLRQIRSLRTQFAFRAQRVRSNAGVTRH